MYVNVYVHVCIFTWNNGYHISWGHLVKLYDVTRSESGLTLLPKLKYEHIHLNNFSKMRVDLATQVNFFIKMLLVFMFYIVSQM